MYDFFDSSRPSARETVRDVFVRFGLAQFSTEKRCYDIDTEAKEGRYSATLVIF